jgi:hypothetical protein
MWISDCLVECDESTVQYTVWMTGDKDGGTGIDDGYGG